MGFRISFSTAVLGGSHHVTYSIHEQDFAKMINDDPFFCKLITNKYLCEEVKKVLFFLLLILYSHNIILKSVLLFH